MQYVHTTSSRKGIEADAKNVGRKTVHKKSTVYTIQYKTVRKKTRQINRAKRCRGDIAKVGLTD